MKEFLAKNKMKVVAIVGTVILSATAAALKISSDALCDLICDKCAAVESVVEGPAPAPEPAPAAEPLPEK